MGAFVPVCLADMFLIKAIALVALGLVAYLYWTSLREKWGRRRQRRLSGESRRTHAEQAAQNVKPPGTT